MALKLWKRDSHARRVEPYTQICLAGWCVPPKETYSPAFAYYEWIFRGYEDDSTVFSKFSGIQRNGTEYVLVIRKDLSQFHLSGHEGSCLNSKELEFQKGDLPSIVLILQYVNTFYLCTGFEDDEQVVIRSDDYMCIFRQTNRQGNGPELTKIVSKSCLLLV